MNKLNDLDLDNWKQYDETIYTDSLWMIGKRDNSGAHHAGYHGLFIPEIPRQAMLRYTKHGDTVLDPFLGSGTTLIEASRLGRNAIGIDLNCDIAINAIETAGSEPNPYNMATVAFHANSCCVNVYNRIEKEYGELNLSILHPPYHDIIQFSDNPDDLSNCGTVENFISKMQLVFTYNYNILKKGSFMVLVIGDYYANSQHVPLSYWLMQKALDTGFKLKAHVVKNIENNRGKANQQNLWRYRALQNGFYIFKHENIFFFWK